VGLIQRVIEAAGIATISITLSKDITRQVKPPRAIYPGYPLGHPLGFPGQALRHLQLLRVLLKYLEEIHSPGTLVELNSSDCQDPSFDDTLCGA
jgi:D-proline reductase (dithiol) PrdB